MEVIPTWPVTSAGWTPLTLGELRWHHHSQSSGGRNAWHWQAEECRVATEGESDSTSLQSSPMVNPGVAPPPGFRGIVAPMEAPPETRLPDVMVGPQWQLCLPPG